VSDHVLLPWAQDHFLHGHQLSSWITDYIDLEESLAVGSIAQEELAHASLLLELAGYDETGRDEVVYCWDPARWSPAELVTLPVDDWPSTVLQGLLLSTAASARTAWLGRASDASRRHAATVLIAEQTLHITHWRRWVHRLAADPRTAGRLPASVDALLAASGDLLDGLPYQDLETTRQAWWAAVSEALAGAGLSVPTLPPPARARRPGNQLADLPRILAPIRELRTTPDDGVVGIYR
jgi:phenylacetate-CoA oxygenase PaaI subunit